MILSFISDNIDIYQVFNIVQHNIYLGDTPNGDVFEIDVSSKLIWDMKFASSAANSIKLHASYDNTGEKYTDVYFEGTRTALHTNPVIGKLMRLLAPTARFVGCESTTPEVPWYTTKAIEKGLTIDPTDQGWNQFSYWRNVVKEVKK